ncbi:MAG UNVERIFIED_CONTAM: polysaccharide deacetylase family protein [Planctomycetaceae bacterium]|jgi:hypothetical protein
MHIKHSLRLLVEQGLSWLPCSRLLQLCQQQIVCIYYHRFELHASDFFRGEYSVKSPHQFEHELQALLERFEPLSLADLLQSASGRGPQLRKPGLFLSFDDGYRELFDFAAPVLKRLGMPATVFVTTGLLNNQQWLFEDEIGLLLRRLAELPEVQQARMSRSLPEPVSSHSGQSANSPSTAGCGADMALGLPATLADR